ncbi:MAG: D-tyrosyl-tRNA(Tyr) deacylase [Prevotellaceae bacterium]|nr:D-tyrosyl-tRNA(Tyr) deacylase [Prevotellaceae bacterium]
MRVLVQRVTDAKVVIDGKTFSSIEKGLLLLAGIENADTQEDIHWVASKIIQMRIFDDSDGIMNISVADVGGEIMAVSQFTLFASTHKGNRPSYIRAAKREIAIPLYEQFVSVLGNKLQKEIKTGVFGANMKIISANDGPVTIWLDSKTRE